MRAKAIATMWYFTATLGAALVFQNIGWAITVLVIWGCYLQWALV